VDSSTSNPIFPNSTPDHRLQPAAKPRQAATSSEAGANGICLVQGTCRNQLQAWSSSRAQSQDHWRTGTVVPVSFRGSDGRSGRPNPELLTWQDPEGPA